MREKTIALRHRTMDPVEESGYSRDAVHQKWTAWKFAKEDGFLKKGPSTARIEVNNIQ